VDYCVSGVRSVAKPYIGRLNIPRVRKSLEGSILAFLNTTARNEIINEIDPDTNQQAFTVNVHATRAQEIAGTAIATIRIQPVYTLYYIDADVFLS
jgi:hypothetical protein